MPPNPLKGAIQAGEITTPLSRIPEKVGKTTNEARQSDAGIDSALQGGGIPWAKMAKWCIFARFLHL